MATNTNLKAGMSNVINGLGTYTHVVQGSTAFPVYGFTVRSDINSTASQPSSLSIVVAQSGSATASFTSLPPATHQRHVDLQGSFNVQVGDVITVTISSSAVADNQFNSVKTIVTLHSGSAN